MHPKSCIQNAGGGGGGRAQPTRESLLHGWEDKGVDGVGGDLAPPRKIGVSCLWEHFSRWDLGGGGGVGRVRRRLPSPSSISMRNERGRSLRPGIGFNQGKEERKKVL